MVPIPDSMEVWMHVFMEKWKQEKNSCGQKFNLEHAKLLYNAEVIMSIVHNEAEKEKEAYRTSKQTDRETN